MAGEAYDAIVIGAGFGGSACAGLLAKEGLRLLLVEKNQRAGGTGVGTQQAIESGINVAAAVVTHVAKRKLDG